MQVELLGRVHRRDPRPGLHGVGVDPSRHVDEADDRRQPHLAAFDDERVVVQLAHEPAEPDLGSASGRVREQEREVAPREADGVELASVRLHDVDDLGEDRVPCPLAELSRDDWQLVECEVRERRRPLDAPDALDLEPQHHREALLGVRARDRVAQHLRARNGAPLEPSTDARAELAGIRAVRDDVVGPSVERLHERCEVVGAGHHDRRDAACAARRSRSRSSKPRESPGTRTRSGAASRR